jgi:two-component system sensor histidine kinase UhpB
VAEAYQNHQPFSFEHRIIRPDGSIRFLYGQGYIILDKLGQPLKMIGTGQDITERKKAEAELIEVQRRLVEGREQAYLDLAQALSGGPLQNLHGLEDQFAALKAELFDEQVLARLAAIQAKLQETAQALQMICHELRPPALASSGLEEAVRTHAESFQVRYPELKIELDLRADGQMLPEEIGLTLFRVYQETLNHLVGQAAVSQVWVRFKVESEQVVLEIQDNREGFETPERQIDLVRLGYLGLVGLIERVEAIGGQLKIMSEPGKGATVQVTIPGSF